MGHTLPFKIESSSTEELVFLLDSLISSPLCSHTKYWICYLYLRNYPWVAIELQLSVHDFQGGRPVVEYWNSSKPTPLSLAELASHIKTLNRPHSRITSLEQAQLWKLTTDQWTWQQACDVARRYLPRKSTWFALQGKFTVWDFVTGRSFPVFIEKHWRRLLSQSRPDFANAHWQQSRHPDGQDRCRCPGRELAPLLASQTYDTLSGDMAEAVMKEILSHVDLRILVAMGPDLCRVEDSRSRRASQAGLEGWYAPESPAGGWGSLSKFKALAAVADRVVRAFERIRNDPEVMSLARTDLAEERECLARKLKAR